MRHSAVVLLALILALAALPTNLVSIRAQDATPPVALAEHPLVGSWLIAVAEDPSQPQTLNTFWADGNALLTVSDGPIFQGTWVATGRRTAALTLFAIAGPLARMPSVSSVYRRRSTRWPRQGTRSAARPTSRRSPTTGQCWSPSTFR